MASSGTFFSDPPDAEECLDIADTLRRSSDVLLSRGWCQQHLVDSEGRVCAAGSVAISVGYRPNSIGHQRLPAHGELALEILGQAVGIAVPFWNDAPGRTQDEVVELMRAVALGLEVKALALAQEVEVA